MKQRVLVVAAVAAAAALGGSMTSMGSTVAEQPASNAQSDRWVRAATPPTRPVGPAPQVGYGGTTVSAANPYLGLVPDPADIRWKYWQRKMAQQSQLTAAKTPVVTPIVHDELEPRGTRGSNDRRVNAETLAGFGLGAGETSAVRILGALSPSSPRYHSIDTEEDNGEIKKATPTAINRAGEGIKIRSRIGDGPHGSNGTGSGDFDIYKISARKGQLLTASVKDSDFSALVVVYQKFRYGWDWVDVGFPTLNFYVPEDGNYHVLVAASDSYLENPMDSGSGTGAGEEGRYELKMGLSLLDRDFYRVHLRSGDVLGGTVNNGSENLSVMRPDGTEVFGSTQDASFIYPVESPLPGGGLATVSYVAEQPGWYTVSTERGKGSYDALLELYRPGAEREPTGSVQKIFLDFDGERVNTGMWGGVGVSNLSPLTAFLGRWRLPAAAEDKLIDEVVATVKENLRNDLMARGLNDDVRVRILNSRDHADPFGQDNVSRVIVGGTINESGVFTIGIAESIDPGNFAHEESALVLLDILSKPAESRFGDASLNHYINGDSRKVAFIGRALGNVVSHEAGHFVGSFHVDQFNPRANLMDQGGNFAKMFGVGPDRVGGTADDRDVDFGEDELNPWEGFTGIEDTLNYTAWAFRAGR